MVITGIYKITSPSNKIYIGQSMDINRRFKEYTLISQNKRKRKICYSIQKYGFDSHKFELIEECNIEQLNERETHWKQYYLDLVNQDWNKVLFHELHDGGGGPKSEITKQRMSLSSIGKSKSKEHCDKISKSKSGVSINSKKVIQYDLESNYINEWFSMSKASKDLNININCISACCKDKQKTAGGYKWKYKNK